MHLAVWSQFGHTFELLVESTRVSEWLAPPRFSAHLWLGHVPSSWHVDIFMRCDQVSVLREPVASRMVRPRGCGTRCDQSRWSVIFMLYTGGHAGILAFFFICARRLQRCVVATASLGARSHATHTHSAAAVCSVDVVYSVSHATPAFAFVPNSLK